MMLRYLLAPLSLSYAAALAVKNHAYTQGRLSQQRLRQPVISIGNLSVGGAGKTPLVIALAQLLAGRGLHPVVLSRGYGRRSPQVTERVGAEGDAARFGDEPLLMARAGLPVYVGASRYAAGLLAGRSPGDAPGVFLLDDGFQHRSLARTVDIVVIHPDDAAGSLLPAGRLREPFSALSRADFLVMREDDDASELALLREGIRKPVWRVRRTVAIPSLASPAFAFCAIAHPAEFFQSLRSQGVELAGTLAFRDHHRFTPADLHAIAARAGGCSALLTTEKDLVRLTREQRAELARTAPLLPVPLRAELVDADRRLDALLDLVDARRRAGGAMRE